TPAQAPSSHRHTQGQQHTQRTAMPDSPQTFRLVSLQLPLSSAFDTAKAPASPMLFPAAPQHSRKHESAILPPSHAAHSHA
ncbi:MAG: hypothetical protein VXW43_19740, partial [Pseudomonadota bacterium]|nr:hypothetical protein [Pseudomonadota bacterium]